MKTCMQEFKSVLQTYFYNCEFTNNVDGSGCGRALIES